MWCAPAGKGGGISTVTISPLGPKSADCTPFALCHLAVTVSARKTGGPVSAVAMLAILSPVSSALLALNYLRQPTRQVKMWTWCDDVVEAKDNPFTIDDYTRMVDDEVRTAGFRMAIERRLRHHPKSVVLDIGTGPFALLALFAAQLGARKVYAVEASATAAEQARATVAAAEESGAIPPGVIEIVEGFSTAVTLPERADLLVCEIVGSIASEEGMYSTYRDARLRHLKRPEHATSYIPMRCQTVAAPASFSSHHHSEYGWAKRHQPLRLDCYNWGLVPLAPPQLLEDFACGGEDPPPGPGVHALAVAPLEFHASAAKMEANRRTLAEALELEEGMNAPRAAHAAADVSGSLSGIACWPRLVLDEGSSEEDEQPIVVEARGMGGEVRLSSWNTLLLLLDDEPVRIRAGDTVSVECYVDIGAEIDTPPRYTMKARVEPAR